MGLRRGKVGRWAALCLAACILAGCGTGAGPAHPGGPTPGRPGALRPGRIPAPLSPVDIYAADRPNRLSRVVRGDPALVYVPNSKSDTVYVI